MAAVTPLTVLPTIADRRIRLAGTEVRVMEAGEGPPVLLLHGFGDSVNTWLQVIPSLARRHRVLALDFPGFGESGPPRSGPLIDGLVDVVSALLDQECAEVPVALVGSSMGGAVALKYAVAHEDRVGRLVLVGCAGLTRGVPLWWRLLTAELLPLRILAHRALAPIPAWVMEAVAGRVYTFLAFADPASADVETVRGFARFYRRSSDIERIFRLGNLLVRELQDGCVLDQLATLQVPMLLVWGRWDRLVPVDQAISLQATVPAARLRIIERSGHCPQAERPDEFLLAVERFLSRRTVARTVASDARPGQLPA